jgi:hypothetical protein
MHSRRRTDPALPRSTFRNEPVASRTTPASAIAQQRLSLLLGRFINQ